jgi:ribose transport system substrate-binding protein
MKKILVLLMVLVLTFGLVACGTGETSDETAGSDASDQDTATDDTTDDDAASDDATTDDGEADDILIGVSIWSSTDALGSQCKWIVDAAAEALGVKTMYVDQGHVSEQVTASVETLAAAGCDGIIICNSSSAEMTSVINTCDEYGIYASQFFRIIDPDDNPDEYALACNSPYFVGAVHEDEVANGQNLVKILCEKGCRKIALQGWNAGDATYLLREQGYKEGIAKWNEENPDDQAVLLDVQYGGHTSDTGRATAEAIISANPDIDALIVAGGGGGALIGAITAIENQGLTDQIKVVSTDFLEDLEERLENGSIAAESGGHYADPLFAFMMTYQAIKGDLVKPEGSFYEILFPYLYVASPEDYAAYDQYFVQDLPYTSEEFVEMAGYSFDELAACAGALSIEDVQQRHGG